MATATPPASSPAASTAPQGLSISRRVQALRPSATITFMNRAKVMQRQGIDVLSFAAGEPDFDTPHIIKEAAEKALEAGQTKYTPTFGDPETRAAIANKLIKENGIPTAESGDLIAISPGGKASLFVSVHCLFDIPSRGEEPMECVLPVPTWVSYAPVVELAGGKVVEVPTSPKGDFKITPDQLRRAITPRSRLFIINSPNNPCGTMYTQAELRALAAVIDDAARTIAPNLVVLSDELYEKIVYGGIPHFSIGSVPAIAERTLTINGLSKAYAMTGWRIGYLAACGDFGKKFIAAMQSFQGAITTNITSFTYPAIRTALTQTAPEVEKMRQAFASRAAVIHRRMIKVPGIGAERCPKPTGAFYVFPDISAFLGKTSPGGHGKPGRRLTTSLDFCEALLEEAHVAFVPGEDFGGCGKNHVRVSFACSEEQIEKGMDRFEGWVAGLR
jgi:aspartate aminotransferase